MQRTLPGEGRKDWVQVTCLLVGTELQFYSLNSWPCWERPHGSELWSPGVSKSWKGCWISLAFLNSWVGQALVPGPRWRQTEACPDILLQSLGPELSWFPSLLPPNLREEEERGMLFQQEGLQNSHYFHCFPRSGLQMGQDRALTSLTGQR